MTTLERSAQASLAYHGKSFRWAQFFLPKRESRDAAVVYAFCRFIDDLVDETSDVEEARTGLARVRAMLEGKASPDELTSAYLETSAKNSFGVTPALDLLRGAESDLGRVRIETDEELALYCYRVAGTVGLMMAGVLGVSDPDARRHAIHLGMAMQITNICRDVREDAERDRIYLPLERLRNASIDPEGLLSPNSSRIDREALGKVVRDLLAIADRYYESGRRGFVFLPGRARLSIAVASRLYAGIGAKLLRVASGDPLRGRVSLGAFEKLGRTASGLVTWAKIGLWGAPRGKHLSLLGPPRESGRVPS